MSTTIDQRVVEMRFDNRNFESNVSTTMSSLEKLKQRLNLTGASKGLDEINHAAKKVDMSGLGTAVQTVHAKFSALEVMGVTALVNITNQAVNAGKRLAAAFTIDPIKTGFQEYELKMGSVQTIMASTGESLQTVNSYLNELNEYSDKTIYSFSDMTQNIGKFTNAGVKLEDAVMAIKGISNEAAISGANANEASRAMYNFAQALSAGYVKLIDWKSIENANMATVEFKQQLIDAAVAAGTLEKQADGMYRVLTTNTQGSEFDQTISATKYFNDSLNYQWMTTEVLVNTLKDYADETTDIGKKAFAAAQDVKTFSMMMDTLKESVQSGWAQTWEILVGDFEEAKDLWTNLTNFFSGFIEKSAEARNTLLSGALDSNWDKLISKIEAAGLSAEDFQSALTATAKENGISLDKLIEKHGSLAAAFRSGELSSSIIIRALRRIIGVEEEITKTTEDLGEIVDKVINGEFGVGKERIDKLTEAGYNYAQVQNLVNEKLGSSVRHYYELSEEQKKNADSLVKLTDAQLKCKGYTDEQIEALRELEKAATDSGTSINDLIYNMEQMSGRELIIESFKNIAKYISDILVPLKEAYNDVFGDTFSTENMSDGLYDLINGFYELTESLTVTEEQAANFKSVFEGLLSIFKVTGSIAGKSVLSAIKLLDAVLSLFGTDILGVAGQIGECITQFANWLDTNTIFMNQIDKLAEVIHAVIVGIKGCVDAFLELDAVSSGVNKFIEFIKDAFDQLGISLDNLFGGDAKGFDKIIEMINGFFADMQTAIRNLDTSELGSFIIKGLVIGLLTGASGFGIVKVMSRIGLMLINGFKAVLGIHSPSRIFIALGGFIIAGLILGIQNGSSEVLNTIVELAKNLFGGMTSAIPEGFNKVKAIFEKNGNDILTSLQTIFTNIGDFLVDHVGGVFAKAIDLLSKIDIGGIIAIAAGAGIIMAINKMLGLLENVTSPLQGLTNAFNGAAGALKALKKRIEGSKLESAAKSILKIAFAIGILAVSLFVVASIPNEDLLPALASIAVMIILVGAIAALSAKVGSVDINANLGKLSLALMGLSGAFILMAATIKILSGIDSAGMSKAVKAFGIMIAGVVAITLSMMGLNKQFNDQVISKVGWTFIKLSVALLIMTLVMKQIAKMSAIDIVKSLGTLLVLELFFAGMVAICKLTETGGFADNAGGMMLKMTAALVLMIVVCKLAGKLEAHELLKGMGVMVVFGLLVAVMAKIARKAGPHIGKVGVMALGVSAALILMIQACKLAGKLSLGDVVKGTGAIIALGALMVALIKVTKGAGKNFISVGVSLILMSAALLLLVGMMYIIKELEWAEVGKSLLVVGVLEGLFIGLIAVARKAKKVEDTIKWMAITIAILAIAVIALSFIPFEKLAPAVGGIALLMGMFALMVGITKYAKDTKKILGTLITLSVITIILAGIIAALASLPNPDAAVKASVALSLLLTAFVSALVIMSKTKATIKNAKAVLLPMLGVVAGLGLILGLMASFTTKPDSLIPSAIALGVLLNALAISLNILDNTKKISNGTLIAAGTMGAVLILLAAALKILGNMDATSAIGNAVALSVLLVAVSVCVGLLSKMNISVKNALVGILALTLMAVPLLAFVGILALMQNVQNATSNVMALVTLTAALTLMLIPLTILGAFAVSALIGVGLLTLMAVPLLAFVGILALMDGIENATVNTMLLTHLMETMTGVLVVLAVVAPLALLGVKAMASLTILMVAIGALAVGIGALMEKFPSIQKFLDTGLPVLEQLAGSIGRMIGKFVGGIGEGISDSFVKMGEDISTMMESLKKASESAEGIKGDSFKSVSELMDVIVEIGKTTVGTTIADIFTLGGTSMEKFTDDASTFFEGMKTAMSKLDGATFNEPGLDCVMKFAGKLADLESSLDGLYSVMSWLTGRSDLDIFGQNAGDFFKNMKNAMMQLNGVTFNEPGLECVIQFAGKLSEFESKLDGLYGVMSWLTGRTDLDIFGQNAGDFFKNMKNAMMQLNGASFNEPGLDCVMKFAGKLAEFETSLDGLYGVISWMTGRTDLDIFGQNAGEFFSAMKSAMSTLDGTTFNEAGLDSLMTFAERLSEFQTNLEGMRSFMTWCTGLTDISIFGDNAKLFVEAMKTTMQKLDGVTFNEAGLNSLMTFSERLSDFQTNLEGMRSFMTWMTGLTDITIFGDNAKLFVEAMKTTMQKLDGVTFNEAGLDSLMTFAERLSDFQTNLEGMRSFMTWCTGLTDITVFGDNAALFIDAMKTSMSTLDGVKFNTEAMDAVIIAAEKLAGLQSQLDSVGGVVDWFTGRDDLGTFGTNIGLFATAMGTLKTEMGEDGITEDVVTSVINAGNAIIELQKALPEESWFDGKMNLTEFSQYVTDFSEALGNFASKSAAIDTEAVNTAISTAYRIKHLISSFKDLDTSGLSTFTGVGTGGIGADGAAYKIAQAISSFSTEVAGIDTEAVSVSVSAAQKLKSLIAGLVDIDTSGVEPFKKVNSIGSTMKAYATSVAEIDSFAVSSSIISIRKLINLIESMIGLDTSGVAAFSAAVSDLGKVKMNELADAVGDVSKFTTIGTSIVDALTKGITSKQASMSIVGNGLIAKFADGVKARQTTVVTNVNNILAAMRKAISSKETVFRTAGMTLMTRLISGMTSQSNKVKSAATSSVSNAASGIKNYYDSFYNAGSYLVDGLAAGISDNAYKAAEEAAAMASEAYKAAKEELDINSPSKIFRSLGYSVPEGFAMGIDKMSRVVKVSAVDMADTAIKSVSKSIARIAEAVNSDIDAQPTIRPVLDLSDVKSGAASISGLFNSPHSIGVAANVGVISTMMNSRSQNGVNDDVVSAIDKLRKDMSNMGNTYYTIDGVTYDDGSNIATAMETIVQSARIARRV